MNITAKKVANDYWVVQQNGNKVGFIRVKPKQTILNIGSKQEVFDSLEDITKKYQIALSTLPTTNSAGASCLGYPVKGQAFNPVWDIEHKLPLYTETKKSRAKRGAGYYMIQKNNNKWKLAYCPKLLLLIRNKYIGPFQTAENALESINNDPF